MKTRQSLEDNSIQSHSTKEINIIQWTAVHLTVC